MAKTFYYDSSGLLEATINDGTRNINSETGQISFSDGTTITNEKRLVDGSISTAASDIGASDALKVTFPTAQPIDFLGVYFNAAETNDLAIYYEATANNYSASASITGSFSSGWNLTEFTSRTFATWLLASSSSSGTIDGLTEIIIGKKLAFEVTPDIGISEQEIFGTNINTSIGGNEYAVKLHEPKSTISMSFSNISQTFKENLQTLEAAVQNYKKFIYSEDGTTGTFHYVRLDSPITFVEVAFQRFSASFTLREQPS